MPKHSILLTVFNRDPEVLGATLKALDANDLSDCEVIVVDDGSAVDYTTVKSCYPHVRWIRMEASEYPADTFMLPHDLGGVYNNPALALNRAIDEAKGERLIFVGSDCIVPKKGIKRAKKAGTLPWFGTVVERDDRREIMGGERPVPYHWFLSVEKSAVEAIGGFDEEFLKGLACEDDDFGARLALYCGGAAFALNVIVEHQTHSRFIDERTDEAKIGYDRSIDYLERKWGGNPWPFGTERVRCRRLGSELFASMTLADGAPDPLDGARIDDKDAGLPPDFFEGSKTNGASKRPHLFVGIPSIDGRVSVELRRYLSGLESTAMSGMLPFTVGVAEVTGLAPVQYARNVLCGMALRSGADLIMMIDADMKPTPSMSRILFSDADVIVPRMYRFRHHGVNGIHDGPPELAACATVVKGKERLDVIPEYDAAGLHRIDACGTGCIVIKRAVLDDKRMRVGPDEDGVPAIFQMKYSSTGRITEWEDVDFSLRATKAGYTVAVDFGARCGHMKTLDLDSVAELLHTAPQRGEKRITPEPSIMDQRS